MTTRRVQVLCAICYADGEETAATHKYRTADGGFYDICDVHAKTAKEAGLETTELSDEERCFEVRR